MYKFNTIYNEDCISGMERIPDKSIDMVLCDLPYGTTNNKWDMVIPFDLLWKQYNRIIKENGAVVLFGDGMFTAKLMQSNETTWRYNLVWDKRRGCDFLNANIKPMKSHEDILVFYKAKPTYNKQYWYADPYKKPVNGSLSENYRKRGKTVSESKDGRRNPLTVLSFAKDGASRIHPTQKPVPLFEYLIKTYTNEGDTVLDNCMGSGTTAIAAINTNRKYIGFETDETYFKSANERIEEHNQTLIRSRQCTI